MITRRHFLGGSGALVVHFSLSPPLPVAAEPAAGGQGLPKNLQANPSLDAWLSINADGSVAVRSGKVEIGQGIQTALAQIAAEELDIDIRRVRMSNVDTSASPDESITAGSLSVADSGSALRAAAAQARRILIDLAADATGLTAAELGVDDGRIFRNGQPVGMDYWHLLGDKQFVHTVTEAVAAKAPDHYKLVGTSVARIDIPDKVFGAPIYLHDMRLPGMLHARLVRPPLPGAVLKAIDKQATAQMPGIAAIVQNGSFVAVVAEREEQALAGAQQLARAVVWHEGRKLPDEAKIDRWLREHVEKSTVVGEWGAYRQTENTITRRYTRPYQAHGSISPSIAIAHKTGTTMTIWSHAQGMYPLRGAIAKILNMPATDVRCIHAQGAGCYGQNGADDAACEAALIAQELPGAPIRLLYTRADEFLWEPYGSAMSMQIDAALDYDGTITDWHYQLYSCTHTTRPMGPGGAGNLLAAGQIAAPIPAPAPRSIPQPNGGGDRNAVPLYNFENVRVTKHFVREMPLRVSALRTLGAYANVFAIESFMDELAAAAGKDPIDFRLAHLDDERAVAVLEKLRAMSGWMSRRATGQGQGVGFAKYKNSQAYVAVAAQVSVLAPARKISVHHVMAAVDTGQVINPDGVRNQIEGGIVQGTSWTLKEAVHFSDEQISTHDWLSYPILRFDEIPSIDIAILDQPKSPSLGVGEAAQGPVAAAIANAVNDAVGVRVRHIPLTADQLSAAG